MKPINVKAWAYQWKDGVITASTDRGQQTDRMTRVLIIDPRHFDVVPKKKGKVKRGK